MRNITLRLATIQDVPFLLPLMAQLGYPTSTEELTKRFESFTTLAGYGVAVACCDLKIIGWIAWSRSQLFVADKVRFHIEGLVIDNNYRSQGVGKQLMAFVENIAREFSPAIIDLNSGVRRAKEGVHDFYRNLGYSNEGLMAKLYLWKEI